MTNNIFLFTENNKNMKEFKVPSKLMAVYCLWINEERVYIGKAKNLNTRLIYHRNDCGAFKDRPGSGYEWKINVNKVSYFKCDNKTDLDILETYLINYYNAKHNIYKKYKNISTFNIQIPNEIFLDAKIGSFSSWAELVFTDKKYLSKLPEMWNVLKTATELLDIETVKAVNYREGAIRYLVKYEQVKRELNKNLKLNEFYTNAEIKKQLQLACQLHNIKKGYKVTHSITYFYICEYTHKKINNVRKEGYILLNYKPRKSVSFY